MISRAIGGFANAAEAESAEYSSSMGRRGIWQPLWQTPSGGSLRVLTGQATSCPAPCSRATNCSTALAITERDIKEIDGQGKPSANKLANIAQPYGNIVAFVGIDAFTLKSGTPSTFEVSRKIAVMMYNVSPVVEVSVKPKDGEHLLEIV